MRTCAFASSGINSLILITTIGLDDVRLAQGLVIHVIGETGDGVRVATNGLAKLLGIDDEDDVLVLLERGTAGSGSRLVRGGDAEGEKVLERANEHGTSAVLGVRELFSGTHVVELLRERLERE